MIKVCRLTLFLILICLPEVFSWADDMETGLIAQAREAYYRSDTISAESLVGKLKSRQDAMPAPVEEDDYIRQSTLLLYKGLLELDLGEPGISSSTLKEGIELSSAGYDRYGTESLLTLTAYLKSKWMLLQNTRTIIKTGGEIQDLSDQALEMNPHSTLALLMAAQGLVNAPRLFGGNPDKAIELLLNSESLFQESHEKFELYMTLASAALKNKNRREGEKWCRMALVLYPENRQSREMLSSLMSGGNS